MDAAPEVALMDMACLLIVDTHPGLHAPYHVQGSRGPAKPRQRHVPHLPPGKTCRPLLPRCQGQSFLVLFFKKEQLPELTFSCALPAVAQSEVTR
jgi:hypothetical protein